MMPYHRSIFFFFFNDTATTEIYTLSLHDALPISPTASLPPPRRGYGGCSCAAPPGASRWRNWPSSPRGPSPESARSEEHTAELQSRQYLVCRLLLEKKKKKKEKRQHKLRITEKRE